MSLCNESAVIASFICSKCVAIIIIDMIRIPTSI